MSTKLNSQKRLNQISYSIAESIERIRKKFKQQLMLELQKQRVVFKKKTTKTKQAATTINKLVKQIARRKKNVSQLLNNFNLLLSLL